MTPAPGHPARVAGPINASAQTHLVLIPSYNSGPKLIETVREARCYWASVWVVIDGSTDNSMVDVERLAATDAGIRLFVLSRNQGKGAAILHGLRQAEAAGFTYVLTMDGDGQHPAALIPEFMATSIAHPDALILGRPVFDDSAPWIRRMGRKVSNGWTRVETLWRADFDSLFGFRVYPVVRLREILENSCWMRGFDFDAEAAVRLCWAGFATLDVPAPVKYLTVQEGGVSHFHYVRDNLLLAWMHLRLMGSLLRQLPRMMARQLKSSRR